MASCLIIVIMYKFGISTNKIVVVRKRNFSLIPLLRLSSLGFKNV